MAGGMNNSLNGSASSSSLHAGNYLSWLSAVLLQSEDENEVEAELPLPGVEAPPPPPPQEQQPVANLGKRKKRPASGAGKKRGSKAPSGSRRETASGGTSNGDDGAHGRQWTKERASEWWRMVSSPLYPEQEFNREFHVSRRTFCFLCNELGASVGKEDTWLHAAVPVPKRVAACLWRLAHAQPCLKVAQRFGISVSTVHKLRVDFCAAVNSVLLDRFVVWPGASEKHAADVAAKFQEVAGIPGVTGAVYTTHLPIVAPDRNVLDYYNRRHADRNDNKASYSVSIQGTVDAGGAFTDVCIGFPGALSDEEVLLKSDFNNGARQPFRVLGGASYPLTDYMLVPYASSSTNYLTPAQEELNKAVAAGTSVAKQAFMRLKARWGFLRKRTEVKLPELRNIIQTCCALHNICERFGDTLDPELAFDLFDDDMLPEVPMRSAAAAQERDAIADNLLLRKVVEKKGEGIPEGPTVQFVL